MSALPPRFSIDEKIFRLTVLEYKGHFAPIGRRAKSRVHHYVCECDCGDVSTYTQDVLVIAISGRGAELGRRDCDDCASARIKKLRAERAAQRKIGKPVIDENADARREQQFFDKHWRVPNDIKPRLGRDPCAPGIKKRTGGQNFAVLKLAKN